MAKRIIKDLELAEISSVDRPAMSDAVATIMKRHKDDSMPENKIQKNDLMQVISSESNGHVHGIRVEVYNNSLALICLYASNPNSAYSHDHMIIREGEMYRLVMNEGHEHTISRDAVVAAVNNAISKKLVPEDLNVAKLLDEFEKSHGISKRFDLMDEKELEELKKRLERSESINSLTGVEKAFFDELPTDAEKDSFLAKSADDRAKDIEKSQGDDPVVYNVDGVEIRKSAGPAVLALAKSNVELTKANTEFKQIITDLDIAKRVDDELGALTGDSADKAVLLKQIDSIEDAEVRERVLTIVKSHNAEIGKAFGVSGTATTGEFSATLSKGNEAREELTKRCNELVAKGDAKNIPDAQDIVKRADPELYKRAIEG